MGKFYFKTLGCKVNHYESEAMEELFLKRGWTPAEGEEDCDLYVVNTCTVTSMSDAKSRQMANRVKTRNPQAIVAVVGCYPQVQVEDIEKLDQVDIILGTKGRESLPDLVEEFQRTGERIVKIPKLDEDRAFDDLEISTDLATTRAAVKIQEGCDMFCSYCIIPYARGHIASRQADKVLAEAKRLADQGFRELVLTGIHVASYGRDLGGKLDLSDLVQAVAQVPGIQRIRLSSIEPRWVTRDRLKKMKDTGKFCDHFHLSLQSGSDKILKRMNRKYDRALYRKKINLIREVFPDPGLTTDVIVGFPGEEEEDFQDSLDFCKEMAFSRIHVFQYSKRPGTPAALFDDQVPPQVKKERAGRMRALEKDLRYRFLDDHVGKEAEVLFEQNRDGRMEGYTKNYIRVSLPGDDRFAGKLCLVKLGQRKKNKLTGKILKVIDRK